MSSFEWNKIIASVLTAMILAMVSGILATQLVRPKALEKPVFLPAGAEQVAATSAEQPAAAKLEPVEVITHVLVVLRATRSIRPSPLTSPIMVATFP